MTKSSPELNHTQFWPPEKVRMPYALTNRFQKWGVSNPTAFKHDEEGELVPVFDNLHISPISVANTRNPFDRLHSAWTDKFRLNSSFLRSKENYPSLKFIYDSVRMAEEDNFNKPDGYVGSFGAFIKYVLLADTVVLNNHWRPYFWSCRPCQLKYDYLTR